MSFFVHNYWAETLNIPRQLKPNDRLVIKVKSISRRWPLQSNLYMVNLHRKLCRSSLTRMRIFQCNSKFELITNFILILSLEVLKVREDAKNYNKVLLMNFSFFISLRDSQQSFLCKFNTCGLLCKDHLLLLLLMLNPNLLLTFSCLGIFKVPTQWLWTKNDILPHIGIIELLFDLSHTPISPNTIVALENLYQAVRVCNQNGIAVA